MYVSPATTEKHFSQVEELYLQAFPENERKPFNVMRDLIASGGVEMVFFSTLEHPFVGFAISAIHANTVLVDYLAIHPDFRGSGFGSQAIQWLLAYYPTHKIGLEIESTNIESDNLQERQLRKGFYQKNALQVLPFEAEVFGVRFEILANTLSLTPEEYVAVYHEVYGPNSSRHVRVIGL